MAAQRYLNVKYKALPIAKVNVTGISRMGGIKEAISKALSLTVGYGLIQLVDVDNNHITDVDDIPAKYYKSVKKGGLALTVQTIPTPAIAAKRVLDDGETDRSDKRLRSDGDLLSTSTNFKAFENARFINGCIVSPPETCLPFPHNKEIQKVYVRQCYKDVFRLLDTEVEKGCFDLEQQTFFELTTKEAQVLADNRQTLYIIDECNRPPVPSTCVTIFIASSPRSEEYKEFVKQKKPRKWYYPIWTKAELEDCRAKCYPTISNELLEERYEACGGIARFVLETDIYIRIPSVLTNALSDVNAVMAVKHVFEPTDIFPLSYSLVHMLVGTDDYGRPYQFLGLDLASNYVGEKLWEKHPEQMIENLQEMFDWRSNEMPRHLFEIYGHRVFSSGGPSDGSSGRKALKCRNLSDGTESMLRLQDFGGKRAKLKQDPLPDKPIAAYHQPSDDKNFPAIDSLSPQGLFQFTVGTEHPIRNVKFLKKLCDLYHIPPADPPTTKLYFVVPEHRYMDFEEQVFLSAKGKRVVKSLPNVEQYVVELPVGEAE
ncbi:hypothetical protein HDU78_000559 [Chytriomyces hyalinus]|nr:hypothetical protein HDU78_000559 [Chytriomyces hyalinus]